MEAPKSDLKLLQARNYQVEMVDRAKKENTVVFLKTGSGKTFISILLLKTMMNKMLDKDKESRKWGIFLCDTVPIVDQQADEIEGQTSDAIKVGRYVGEVVQSWNRETWEGEFETHHILVMTSQIFLDLLLHAYFKIESACVLIFDECHHTVKNHPYNEIMRQFIHGHRQSNGEISEKPRILGMTSVIPNLTFKDDEERVKWKIRDFEKNLNCKIYTTAYQEELNTCVVPPIFTLRPYSTDINKIYTLPDFKDMYQNKVLNEIVNSVEYTYTDLGLWCYYKHVDNLITHYNNKLQNPKYKEDNDNLNEKIQYLEFLKSHVKENVSEDVMKNILGKKKNNEYFSKKILELCDILKDAMTLIKDFCGIIFVDRRETAQSLCDFLKELSSEKYFNGFYKPAALVGHGDRRLLKGVSMGLKTQREIVKNFRKGLTNLLVATKVAEEGLDIQPCKLVVQFDGIKSIQSFVQSRGRARHGKSYYIILCKDNDTKQRDIIESVERLEKIINKITTEENNSDDEISPNQIKEEEQEFYCVPKTGARVTLHSSISLLYRYCQQLPTDKYCKLGVDFDVTEVEGGFQATAKLPKNAPIKEPIKGKKKYKRSLARQSAALEAIIKLHEQEELDDNLLPCIGTSSSDRETEIINMKEPVKYTKFIPTPLQGKWELMEMEEQEYHLYGISILPKEPEDNQPPSINLGIITTTTFQSFPITLYHDKILEVRFSYIRKVMFNRESQELAKKFHVKFFKKILVNNNKRKYPAQDNGKNYFILPIKDNDLDWSLITDVTTKKRQQASQIPRQKLENRVLTTNYYKRSYYVTAIYTLETIHDTMGDKTYKEYYSSKNIEIQDEDQELVEAVQFPKIKNFLLKKKKIKKEKKYGIRLVPELCWVEYIPANYYQQGRYLPTVLHTLEKQLLCLELNQKTISINPELILEALSASMGQGISYQRMEILGDAILKYLVDVHLYFKYPNKHEGYLSMEKDKIIRNSSLYNWAIQKNIQCYYTPKSFHSSTWFPPGFNKEEEETISKKTIADLVESITGACYIHGGIKCVLDYLEWMGLPDISWAQYEKYQNEALNMKVMFPEELDLVEYFSKKLNYKFRNTDLLLEAVSHTSYPHVSNYQRLEWLGDAILDFLLVKHIYDKFPSANPGEITQLKHSSCQNEVFCLLAYDNQFHKYLRHYSPVFNGVVKRFIEAVEKLNTEIDENTSYLQKVTMLAEKVEVPKLIGDLFESVAGAIFIDSGFNLDVVWQVYSPLMKEVLDCLNKDNLLEHPMTQLIKLLNKKQLRKELEIRKCGRENGYAKVQLIFKSKIIGEDNTAKNNSTSTKRAAKKALQYYKENEL